MKLKRLKGTKRVTYYKLCVFDSNDNLEDALSISDLVEVSYKNGYKLHGYIYTLQEHSLQIDTTDTYITVCYDDIDKIEKWE